MLNDKTNTFHMEKQAEIITIKEGKDGWKFIEKFDLIVKNFNNRKLYVTHFRGLS